MIAGGGVKETKEFQAKVKETYEAASGMLPSGVGLTTFKSVGEQLIKAAYSAGPSAAAIQSISIGKFCSHLSCEEHSTHH